MCTFLGASGCLKGYPESCHLSTWWGMTHQVASRGKVTGQKEGAVSGSGVEAEVGRGTSCVVGLVSPSVADPHKVPPSCLAPATRKIPRQDRSHIS